MPYKNAADIKIDDRIQLDLGYGAHSHDAMCTVLDIKYREVDIWGDFNPMYSFQCSEWKGGNKFWTCDFPPASTVCIE